VAQVLQYGRHAMGKVLIAAQWGMGAAVILLSPVFAILFAWFIGWPRIRGIAASGGSPWIGWRSKEGLRG